MTDRTVMTRRGAVDPAAGPTPDPDTARRVTIGVGSRDGGVPSDEARRHVIDIVRASRSSFSTGMRLLPPQRRLAMYGVYAFCRLIDDIADGDDSATVKRAALTGWEHEIEAVYSGQASHPVSEVLRWAAAAFDLPKAEFIALIDGMRWDVERPAVAPDTDQMLLYARLVAGAAGVLSVRIFGVDHPAADRFAIVLGEALQITNILRDVDEDAAIGRVYVPCTMLEAHGVNVTDPAAILADPGFPAASADLAVLAHDRFDQARDLLAEIRSPRLAPAMVMMAVYGRLLADLTARGWAAPRRDCMIGKTQKAVLAVRAAALGWRWPSLI